MKKLLALLLFYLINVILVQAQSPYAIPFQGVARNISGEVLSTQNIGLRISLHDVTAGGMIVYQETHSATTSNLGLFNINIGNGIPTIGNLASVNWGNGAKFIQIEMDPAGGTSYTDMGTTQLMSVPYALFAANASNGTFDSTTASNGITETANDFRLGGNLLSPTNILQGGNDFSFTGGKVGIGTTSPSTELEINGQVKITGGSPGIDKVLTSNASGVANWVDKVAFASKVGPTTFNVPSASTTTIIFNNELYDDGTSYNPLTGIFTAPSTGRYHFDANLLWLSNGGGSNAYMSLMVNTTIYMSALINNPTNTFYTQIISTDVALNAGDQVKVTLQNNGNMITLYGYNIHCLFSAHKIR